MTMEQATRAARTLRSAFPSARIEIVQGRDPIIFNDPHGSSVQLTTITCHYRTSDYDAAMAYAYRLGEPDPIPGF